MLVQQGNGLHLQPKLLGFATQTLGLDNYPSHFWSVHVRWDAVGSLGHGRCYEIDRGKNNKFPTEIDCEKKEEKQQQVPNM